MSNSYCNIAHLFVFLEIMVHSSYIAGSVLKEAIPEETGSILVQPLCSSEAQGKGNENDVGFVLVASGVSYAYDEKDKLWIKAIANKFKG